MHIASLPRVGAFIVMANALLSSAPVLGLPPTDTFENRMARIGAGPERPFAGVALDEVPDSAEVLELSARLHESLGRVRSLPDSESYLTLTQWRPVRTMLKAKEGSVSFPMDRLAAARKLDPDSTGLERVHQGINRESIKRKFGAFESLHIEDTNTVDTRWGLARRYELVKGQRYVWAEQVGGVEAPMISALERMEKVVPGMNYDYFSAGPTITEETFLLSTIRAVHVDEAAGFNLASVKVERTNPMPHITRYIQTVNYLMRTDFNHYEYDFDARVGGKLVRMYRGWIGDTPAGPMPRTEEYREASYKEVLLGDKQVWLLSSFKEELRGAIKKDDTGYPLPLGQGVTKRFENIRFLDVPHPESVFDPKWARPDAPLLPQVVFRGEVIEDQDAAQALMTTYGS